MYVSKNDRITNGYNSPPPPSYIRKRTIFEFLLLTDGTQLLNIWAMLGP